jgi:anaerobic magnesium-protoporphyrin IX monomethyl ester cyclase
MKNTNNKGKKKNILLIYPFFKPKHDRSIFRFPPLGIAYIASSLRMHGHNVNILDCTFMTRDEALDRALAYDAEIVGIYSMITMREDSIEFAKHLRKTTELLIAGGPMPSSNPELFLPYFDVVVMGEGERTMGELVEAYEKSKDLHSVHGIAFKENNGQDIIKTTSRKYEKSLDALPLPARNLLPNKNYIAFGKKKYGYSITSVMSTRGCPFTCEFCSNSVFGETYRERSPKNVMDEVEQALSLGYEHIHFGDDVFTLKKERLLAMCGEIKRRGLKFKWECLGRIDTLDSEMADAMKSAGCDKMYFGIESGSEPVLRLMNKRITTEKARLAVETAHKAGIKTGAFFILFYPGETDDTVLATIKYALSLPLDYLAFTMPYPIPGTALYKRVKDRAVKSWKQPDGLIFGHKLIFNSDFSEIKMKFGLLKGTLGFMMKTRLGSLGQLAVKLFDKPSALILRLMR